MASTKRKVTPKPRAKRSQAKSTPVKSASRAKSTTATPASTRRFMEARFSEQTVYWLIIGVAVIGLAAWVLSLQVQLNDIYDNIDRQSAETTLRIDKKPTDQPQR